MRKIQDFKGWKLHLEELNRSRRKFLTGLFNVAATTFVSTAVLTSIYKWIKYSYDEEDREMKDGYKLRLSRQAERLLRYYYSEYVSNFDEELMIAKSDVISIFNAWTKKDIYVKLNQKMYDAIVMICFRVGGENLRSSEFIKAVKSSDFKKATDLLQKDKLETLWNCKKSDWLKAYEITMMSSYDGHELGTEDTEEDEPTVTAGGIDTSSDEGLIRLADTDYPNVKYAQKAKNDKVNKKLLEDLQKAAKNAGIVVTITTAKRGHSFFTLLGTESRHRKNIAVDIAILDGIGSDNAVDAYTGNPKFRRAGNKLRDELVNLGYVWNIESGNDKAVLWQTNKGGNHYNHLHVSRKSR